MGSQCPWKESGHYSEIIGAPFKVLSRKVNVCVCVCVDTHIYLKFSIELMVGYNGEREPDVLEPLSYYLENLGVQLAKMIIQALI